jgi:hypothetical protein
MHEEEKGYYGNNLYGYWERNLTGPDEIENQGTYEDWYYENED